MPRRRAAQPAEITEDIALRGYRYTKDQIDEMLHQTEKPERIETG